VTLERVPKSQGVRLKKEHGQHFLRDHQVVRQIVENIDLAHASVFEIGCGDGFLTREILTFPVTRLWVFEIDPEWALYVSTHIKDDHLQVFAEDVLSVDFTRLEEHKPWVLLANLPYQITFPILQRLKEYRHVLREGIVMVQEEVAQKLLKNHGRGYGFWSLFFQYYFEWKLLSKVSPVAFFPPPRVFSRLLYLKPRAHVVTIPEEERFWKFIRACFAQPRRTLKNNLLSYHCNLENISDTVLVLRAQQMDFSQLLDVWNVVR
jgi:16S rRNA (adenine1518-N6/adenine1519-N6)-dimethyltransferase